MPYGNPRRADNFVGGVNHYVANMMLHSHVGSDGISTVDYGAMAAASTNGILAAQSIATALNTTTFAAAGQVRANFGPYGRNVTLVLSGAGAPTVVVHGRDYLGQPVSESFTGNGTTPVAGKKAFASVERITSTVVAATTIDVGYGNVFGLPFKGEALIQENVDDAVTGSAGTFVSAVLTDPQTATTGDPRGTYAPHTSNAPNGTKTHRLLVRCDKTNLHGVRHFFSG